MYCDRSELHKHQRADAAVKSVAPARFPITVYQFLSVAYSAVAGHTVLECPAGGLLPPEQAGIKGARRVPTAPVWPEWPQVQHRLGAVGLTPLSRVLLHTTAPVWLEQPQD